MAAPPLTSAAPPAPGTGREDRAGGSAMDPWPRRLPWLIALAFVLVQVPIASSLGVFHGDERYYTNAVLEMREAGDLTAPLWADGAPRMNKPLLTYWMVEAGFRAVGVSALGARLAFLLAGAAAVLLTARIARVATGGSDAAAAAAAAVFAGSTAVTAAAVRANPDMPLTLGASMLLLGALRLERDPRDRGGAWLVWLGAGVAVAAKLLLGVVALLVLALRAARGRDRAARLRGLAAPLPVAAGALVAAAAVLPLYLGSGAAVDAALQDQVTGKAGLDPSLAAAHAARYAADPLRHFAPFSLIALAGALATRRPRTERERLHDRFTAVAVLAGVAVFALGREHHGRYLLPVYPAAAAWFGAALAGRSGPRSRAVLTASAWLAAGVSAAVAALLHRAPTAAIGCALAAVACAWLARAGRRAPDRAPVAAGAAWLLGTLAVTAAPRVATHTSPVPALADDLGGAPVIVVEEPSRDELWDVAAHLRLESGGRIRAIHAGGPLEPRFPDAPRLTPRALAGDRPVAATYEPIRSARGEGLLRWALHRSDARAEDAAPAYAVIP